MALQDRVLLVVQPERELDDEDGRLYGFARVYSAPPATLPPNPAVAPEEQVLEIRPPQDTRHLLHGLAALWPSYLAYAITFLLIGQVWANHHVMFDHIRVAERTVLFLNTLLLMDIAFLPFAASILAAAFRTGHGQRTAVVFHGLAFELAAILFNAIWDYARHGHRLLGTTIDSVGARAISRRSGSPLPGSPPEPCWAACSPSSAWL